MFRKPNNFIFSLRSKSMISVLGMVLLVRVIVLDEYQKITVKEGFENISLKGEGFYNSDVRIRVLFIMIVKNYSEYVLKPTNKERNKLKKMVEGNKRSMTVMSQNIPQGTCSERVSAYLDNIVEIFKPEVLFVNEVDTKVVDEACPDGYYVISGRLEKAKVIRLSAVIKKSIDVTEMDMSCEIPTVKLKVNGWTVCGVYREWRRGSRTECTASEIIKCLKENPTMPKDTEDLRLQLDRLKSLVKKWKTINEKGKVLVMGDFNINWLHSTTQQYRRLLPLKDLIHEEIMTKDYTQVINDVTRRPVGHQRHEPSCLDHIYCTRGGWISRRWNENIIGRDHNLIGVKCNVDRPFNPEKVFTVRNIKDVCPITFTRIFSYTNPEEILVQTDVNEAVRQWEMRMTFVLDQLAPLKLIKCRESYSPWVSRNDGLRKKKKVVKYLLKWAKRVDTDEGWDHYRKEKHAFYRDCIKEKNNWKRKQFEECKSDAEFWRKLKSISNADVKEESEIVIDEEDGTRVHEPLKVATSLNNYFRDKVTKLKEKINENIDLALNMCDSYISETFGSEEIENFLGPTPVGFQTVNDKVIYNIISSLKSSGAEGVDGMNTVLIKRFKQTITPYLRHIVNLSIMTSTYPSRWKQGIITPLPKGGSRYEKKNWRPIVINAAASKVLEKVIQLQISQHMEYRGLFPSTQHAYRRSRSCESALVDLNTQIENARNKGKYACALITDMSAAFNLISKEVLCAKMSKCGFDTSSCNLLRNYLSERKTQCKVKNSVSELITLPSGVGEGSVLGPTFFACGLIDISEVSRLTKVQCSRQNVEVEVTSVEYADDCTGIIICNSEKDLQVAVNVMLNNFQVYFESNSLCLNQQKCQVLVFRPRTKQMDIYVGNKLEENEVKLLGVFHDTEGNYEAHLRHVETKVNHRLRNIRKCINFLGLMQGKKSCESLVLSILNYGLFLYGQTKSAQVKITRMVNATMRVVMKVVNPVDKHVSDLYMGMEQLSRSCPSGTKWLNGENMYEYTLILLFRRITRTKCSPVTYNSIESVAKRDGLRQGDKNTQVGVRKYPWKDIKSKFADRCVMIMAIRTLNKNKLNWLLLGEDSMKKVQGQNGTVLDSIKLTIKSKIIELNGNENM